MKNYNYLNTYKSPIDGFSCDIYERTEDTNDLLGQNNILACEAVTKNVLFGGSHFATVDCVKHAVDLIAKPPISDSKLPDIQKAQEIWDGLESIIVNDDGEIEKSFLHFSAGTHRYDIWKWLEEEFNISIGSDLLGL